MNSTQKNRVQHVKVTQVIFFCHLSLLKPVQAVSTVLLTSWFNKIPYVSLLCASVSTAVAR